MLPPQSFHALKTKSPPQAARLLQNRAKNENNTSGRCIARRACQVGSSSCFSPPPLRFKILAVFSWKLRQRRHSAAILKRHAASRSPWARDHGERSLRVAPRLLGHAEALASQCDGGGASCRRMMKIEEFCSFSRVVWAMKRC